MTASLLTRRIRSGGNGRLRSRGRRSTPAAPPAPHLPDVLSRSVEWRPIAALKRNPRTARTHPQKQIHQLARAIEEFGFNVPVLIGGDDLILAGHARIDAARKLGLAEVPTLRLTGLSPEQARAFVIAENRLAEHAGWDRDALRIEFEELIELGFEVELTGFDMAEIDILLENGEEGTADDLLPIPAEAAVSQPGDLWQLGEHRLFCGDALDPAAYDRLLDGRKAQMVFTDPPYNVSITRHVGGTGQIRHREFAMASGEMSEAEFTHFLEKVFRLLCRASERASTHFICMDWRHLPEVFRAGLPIYGELRNLCVWNKDNAGLGSFYRSKHELVLVFQNGPGSGINNIQLGATGRYRTNVWDYPGVNGLSGDLALHPTVKPVALVADAIRDCSKRGGVVLDPFGGSGTTIIAAERTGRLGHSIEIDPLYVDTAVRRWQERCGGAAVLAEAGRSFAEVAAERQGERA